MNTPAYGSQQMREPINTIPVGWDQVNQCWRAFAIAADGSLQPAGTAQASVTLTSDATNVTSGDTVTLGSITYRILTTPTQAYDVQRGGTAAITLDNLKAAVNGEGTPGVEYYAGTSAHPSVTATTNTDTTQLFVAKVAGTAGNAIAASEASTHLSFGATTLTGGTNAALTIGGNTPVISITPTVDTTPDYSSGDVLGGLQAITNAARVDGGSGVISSITVSCKVALAIALRFVFFKSNPSATTFTENSTLSLNAADYDKLLAGVEIATTDQFDLGTPDLATKLNINIPFKLASGTTLYVVCLAQGALNLASASDLTFNYGILQD